MKTPRFKIRITRFGYLFIALCIGVGLAGLNTGNNLLYLIFSMMLSFIILSGILSNTTLTKVDLHPNFSKRIFAHETANSQLILKNKKKWFSSYAIRLVPTSKDILNAHSSFILKIKPNKSVYHPCSFSFSKRGWNELPTFTLNTTYPFGLLEKYIQISSPQRTLVYPQIFPEVSIPIEKEHNSLGQTLTYQKTNTGNPFGIRDFVMGDHYKKIHWKSSAKIQKLRVKEFESEENPHIVLHLHLLPDHSPKNTFAEKAISYTASLLLDLKNKSVPFSLNLNNSTFYQSQNSIDEMLSALALVQIPDNLGENLKANLQGIHILITNQLNKTNQTYRYVVDQSHLRKNT